MIFSNLKLYKNVQKLFCHAGKLFSEKFEKLQNFIFGPCNVMLRQPRVRASRISPAQKWLGLRMVLFQKLFKVYIFCFLGHSVG